MAETNLFHESHVLLFIFLPHQFDSDNCHSTQINQTSAKTSKITIIYLRLDLLINCKLTHTLTIFLHVFPVHFKMSCSIEVKPNVNQKLILHN